MIPGQEARHRITSDALLAGVEDAHPRQLAVIRIRERQERRHGRSR
jgi:hypothetical protein